MYSTPVKFILLLFGAAALAGISLYFDIESKNQEVIQERKVRDELRTSLQSAENNLNLARERNGTLEKLIAAADMFNKLQQQVPPLEKELQSVKERFIEHVKKVRLGLVGTTYPELILGENQVLTSVKIQKVNESDISVEHLGGIARIPMSKMPKDFQEKYRYEMPPMLVAEASNPDPSPTPSPSTTPPAKIAKASPRVLSVAETEKVHKMEASVAEMIALRNKWYQDLQVSKSKMNGYVLKDQAAMLAGKPRRYEKVIETLNTGSDQLLERFNGMNNRIVNLQIEIERIKESPGTLEPEGGAAASAK